MGKLIFEFPHIPVKKVGEWGNVYNSPITPQNPNTPKKQNEPMNEPILTGRIEGRFLKAYCPRCKRDHIHGAPNDDSKLVHRIAHCSRPVPYAGYVIEIDNPTNP